jgi:hypothetical protein
LATGYIVVDETAGGLVAELRYLKGQDAVSA